MKRWIVLILIVALIVPVLLAVPVSAESVLYTGQANADGSVIYTLYDNGLMEFSGSGQTWGFNSSFLSPWRFYLELITSASVKEGITWLGANTFYYSSNVCNLSEVSLPSTLTGIGDGCFRNCPLTSVVIPSAVETIGELAFYNTDITDVYFLGDTPPYLDIYSSTLYPFDSSSVANIYVPEGALSAYQSSFPAKYQAYLKEGSPPASDPSVPTVSASFEGQTIRIDSGATIDFYITAFGANGTVTCEYYINGEPYGEVFPFYAFGDVDGQFMQAWRYTPVGDGIREIYAVVTNTVGSNVVTVSTGSCTVIVGDVSGGDDSGGGSSGDDSEVIGKLDSLEQEMDNLQGSVDDLGNKVDGIQGTVDDMAGNIEQLPEDFENALEQSQQNEKNEALQSGDDGAQEVIEIIPNPSNDFLPAFQNLVSVMKYDGTSAALTLPAVSIPEIPGVLPKIQLMDSQELDFQDYITLIPETIMNLIIALFDAALVLYCLYELFDVIGAALTGFRKIKD